MTTRMTYSGEGEVLSGLEHGEVEVKTRQTWVRFQLTLGRPKMWSIMTGWRQERGRDGGRHPGECSGCGAGQSRHVILSPEQRFSQHGGHINFSRAGKGVGKASPIVLFARLSDGFQSALKATLI